MFLAFPRASCVYSNSMSRQSHAGIVSKWLNIASKFY